MDDRPVIGISVINWRRQELDTVTIGIKQIDIIRVPKTVPVQTVLTRRAMREAVRQVRETTAAESQCDGVRNDVIRCSWQVCRSVLG